MKPRRWFAHVAVLFGVVALVLASINSSSHVERIQPDRTEQIAAIEAEKAAKLQAAVDSRGEDVADIRFAEDSADDFIDRAGMDESDLKYMEKIEEDTAPAWQKNKKSRSSGGGDADLEDLIGADEAPEGVVSEALDRAEEEEPIVMSSKDMDMANRLDSLNLKAIRIMILLGLIFVVIDYLRRANVYREAYSPLPLPSAWVNSFTPPPVIEQRPEAARRGVPKELAWFTRRGDPFLYITGDPSKASQLPESMPKLGRKCKMIDLLRIGNGGEDFKHEFVFETLWFGRASFVLDSPERAKELMEDFAERLKKRKSARARVRQTVHIVWDLKEPVPETVIRTFEMLAPSTGFSLFVCARSSAN
jgi:hypothetical protein